MNKDFNYAEAIEVIAWKKLKEEYPKTFEFLKQNNVSGSCTVNYSGYDFWIEFECVKFHYGSTTNMIKIIFDNIANESHK